MKINEIFYSLQGEGKWSGLPNIFIRTSGCNLRCSYCDTKYAYEKGEQKKSNEIINYIKKYPCKKICITGGEPLLQNNIEKLIRKLEEKNYHIIIETNGSKNIKKISGFENLTISLDIKCPSSNMAEKMNFKNLKFLRKKDQLKFVIKNKNDYNYAKEILDKYNIKCSIYFQPVWKTNVKKIAEWILTDGLNVRLGLQLHKFIWKESLNSR